MIFNQVNIVSADPEATIAFYRLLGVDISADDAFRQEGGIAHANSTEQSTSLHLDVDSPGFASFWNTAWRDRDDLAGKIVLGFAAASREEVDRIYALLIAQNHPGLQQPYDAFWGARYAIVEDPDGIAVGIMSPRSNEHRSPPPSS